MSRQISIKTDTGTIILYGDEKTQTAGMTFIPNDNNEEIDLVYAACVDKNGKDSNHPDHGDLKNIDIFCYEDVWDENYTHKFQIDTDEADKALTESKPFITLPRVMSQKGECRILTDDESIKDAQNAIVHGILVDCGDGNDSNWADIEIL